MTDSALPRPKELGSHIGCVKWFNNKIGYGFITVRLNNEDVDLFTHQTNIYPTKSSYRTLTLGEYVSLNISENESNRQAVDITGVNGGPLMCDQRLNRRKGVDHTSNNVTSLDCLESV